MQSKVSICMAHGHIYLSEARQLHHGRFRHIKPNANCQSKGRGRQGSLRVRQEETGWDTGMFTNSSEQIFSSSLSQAFIVSIFFLAIWLITVFFSFCLSKSSLSQVLISFYTKTSTSRSDTHQNLWPKHLTYTTVWGDWFTPHTAAAINMTRLVGLFSSVTVSDCCVIRPKNYFLCLSKTHICQK